MSKMTLKIGTGVPRSGAPQRAKRPCSRPHYGGEDVAAGNDTDEPDAISTIFDSAWVRPTSWWRVRPWIIRRD